MSTPTKDVARLPFPTPQTPRFTSNKGKDTSASSNTNPNNVKVTARSGLKVIPADTDDYIDLTRDEPEEADEGKTKWVYLDTPSPSAASDSDEDSGSDFTPGSPTPLRQLRIEAGGTGGADQDDQYEYDDDIKPILKRKGPSANGSPKKARTSGSSASGTPGSRGRGSASIVKRENGTTFKTGAWDGEEDYILFQALHPKVSPSWAAIGEQLGRDAKSCQNRYAVLSKKLPGAIKAISKA